MTVATLHAPAQDRPAVADITTMILFELMRKRAWRMVGSSVFIAVAVGPWLALAAYAFEDDPPYPIVSGAVLFLSFVAFSAWLWILWVPRGAALLRAQAWREARARVVRAGRPSLTSLVECDGDVLRVSRLTAAHHALIARTGRVWVVGPDDKGWASVRVDGSHVAFPARRAKAARGVSVTVDGDVTALTAARMRFGATAHLRLLAAVLAWMAVMVVLGVRWSYVGGILGASVAITVMRRSAIIDRQLPALVSAAEWCELPVLMNPWLWWDNDTSTAEGTVWLPNGRMLAVRMPNAPIDLLGTIYERGTVWFSAPPESGKAVAVGFPGYPLLAVATIR